MAGILYRVRMGCQWNALPNDFQKWVNLGVFAAIHRGLLKYNDGKRGIAWKWSSWTAPR